LKASKQEAQMIDVKAIGHVTFETPDIERMVAYYTEVLGLHVAYFDANRVILASHLGQESVALEKGSAPRCTRISLHIAPGTDLAAVAKLLQDREGIVSQRRSGITPGIADALVFSDPIGTAVELYADANTSPRHEPVGISPLKLGHIAFTCHDVKHQTDFYCRVLGFRVSDWMEDHFAFLRCGPDHHTINFATAKSVKLHHVAFGLRDWSHIGNACELLGRKRLPIIWGPGRHGIGHNVFIYHRNPDDQIVECYTDLDMMLDESLGYFDPRPWHHDNPQKPKVWKKADAALTWGPPPAPDYMRGKD
jgi:catechol-2,3-dioxygenase